MRFIPCIYLLVLITVKAHTQTIGSPLPSNWCQHPLRAAFQKLPEIKVTQSWFRVFRAGKDVIAITEPYNFEEVISYLILGKDKALLFDTGLGVDTISPVIRQLTHLPVIVLNSHTHFDHTGGNYEFPTILALRTDFTIKHAREGWDHALLRQEVSPEAICLDRIPGFDTARYAVRPFKISRFIQDGEEIDLGQRKLQIIAVPGHTPDALALLDKDHGYLWTGDTFYEGPIYLFAKETDLFAYEKSIAKLAALAPQLKVIFPSHNNPVADPARLIALKKNFARVKAGKVKGADAGNQSLLFQFPYFGLLIRKDRLLALQRLQDPG